MPSIIVAPSEERRHQESLCRDTTLILFDPISKLSRLQRLKKARELIEENTTKIQAEISKLENLIQSLKKRAGDHVAEIKNLQQKIIFKNSLINNYTAAILHSIDNLIREERKKESLTQ